MREDKNTKSKFSYFLTKSISKLQHLPFLKNSYIKPLLTVFSLSCTATPVGVSSPSFPQQPNTSETIFKPAPSFKSSTTFPRDNIVRAFKEGRARSISEFLKLYDTHFKYDTLIINKDNVNTRLCHGQYIRKKDLIEIKYFLPDTTNATPKQAKTILAFCSALNDDRYQIPVKAHECSHKSFHNEGGIKVFDCVTRPNPFYFDSIKVPYKAPAPKVKVFRLGLRTVACLNQWNEIGGDLGYLIAERELYLQTKDSSVFTYKTAYTEAIKNKEIDPFTSSRSNRQKEYALLINSTIEW